MGKPTICIGENKGPDQLRGNREADQRLCFRYSDSTIPLLLKSEISSFWLFSVLVQVGLCRTWSETQIFGFVTHRLIFLISSRVTKPRLLLRRLCVRSPSQLDCGARRQTWKTNLKPRKEYLEKVCEPLHEKTNNLVF